MQAITYRGEFKSSEGLHSRVKMTSPVSILQLHRELSVTIIVIKPPKGGGKLGSGATISEKPLIGDYRLIGGLKSDYRLPISDVIL